MVYEFATFCKDFEKYSERKGLSVLKCYINGNHYTGIMSDGTRIRATRETEDDRFLYDFAENCDVKITNHCTAGCPFCHEGSSKDGKHADLSLPIFDTWKPGTEIAIGGGNVLDHPDLIPFLTKLKKQEVVCNITVNQRAVDEQYTLLQKIVTENLVNGVGISITDPLNEKQMKAVDDLYEDTGCRNFVCHVIVGIVDKNFIPVLQGRKVLFLGYKNNVGRGVSYNEQNEIKIKENTEWLINNLKDLSTKFQVMSFDNLALAQLDAKNVLGLSEEEWKLRFQGKDYGDVNGTEAPSTFYFDAVNQTIGRSSTQPYNERVKYSGQTFEEAFKVSLSNYKVNEDQYGELKLSEEK